MFLDRLERVKDKMKEKNLKQIVVSDSNALFYLTGSWFHTGERMIALLISENKPVLFLNDLFSFSDKDILVVSYNDTEVGTDKMLKYIDKDETLGIDKFLPSKFLLELQAKNAAKSYTLGSVVIDECRAIKDKYEQELMIESSKTNDRCMERFKNILRLGISEKEVQDEIYKIYKEEGCEDVSFTPIVAFKATAADPHHEPDTKTILEQGDMVLLDVGGKKNNYCSDMTRVFFTKSPTKFEEEIYNLVRKANEEAIKMIKPGVRLKDVDKCARDIIEKAGYGKYFNHRLGHFIGIEDHDQGDVSLTSEIIAKEGMIFSIEPGIYIKDKIGVRIEDLVMVTKDSVKVLNSYPKDIEILNLK